MTQSAQSDYAQVGQAIKRQFENQVAFFNIGKEHAFFFCSPDEARHAMDAVRRYREEGWNHRERVDARDAYKACLMSSKAWEGVHYTRRVISTDGALTVAAFNCAISCLENEFRAEHKGPEVDLAVMHPIRFGDARVWGDWICRRASDEDRCDRNVWAVIFDRVEVYVDNDMPTDMVLVAASPTRHWEGMTSRVQVVS